MFAISWQYLMKELSDEIKFLYTDKHGKTNWYNEFIVRNPPFLKRGVDLTKNPKKGGDRKIAEV